MLIVAGMFLLVLGIACGALLVLAPLGLVPTEAGTSLWLLFPFFTITGYLLAAAPSDDRRVPMLSRVTGSLLILLALASATALVLHGSGMIAPRGESWSLWYVMAIGLVVGAMALASHRSR